MRISDWSSDVCSSDLELVALTSIAWCVVARWRWRAWLIGPLVFATALLVLMLPMEFGALLRSTRYPVVRVHPAEPVPGAPIRDQFLIDRSAQIGRASYRARVCQYV